MFNKIYYIRRIETLAQFGNPEGPVKHEPRAAGLPKTVKATSRSVQVKVE
jgi:hypothetical protein